MTTKINVKRNSAPLPSAKPGHSGEPATGCTTKKNSSGKTTDCPPFVGSTTEGQCC